MPTRTTLIRSCLLAAALAVQALAADGLDPASLLQPPTTVWPTYNGDYSGRRYSTLKQINQGNVNQLTLAWMASMKSVSIKATPLEVSGILYFTTPDNVWAADARTGRTIWHYFRGSEGDHIGQRGVGMYKDWLYFVTPDGHLVSLEAKNGKVRFDIELADPKLGYFSTMAPLVVRDRIIVGVSGDTTDIPGFLVAIDPETGKEQWKFFTEPKAGEPGSETWPQGTDAISHGGGMTWMTGHLRPRDEHFVLGYRQPQPRAQRRYSQGRQLIYLLDCGAGRGYGKAEVVLSAFAARYPRLGRGADSGSVQ